MATYTQKETDKITADYTAEPCRETVDRLAEELGKKPRSIIAKLASAGAYKKPVRRTKTGEEIESKADIARMIGDAFGVEIPSLEKAGKEDLKKLREKLMSVLDVRAHLIDLEYEENEV